MFRSCDSIMQSPAVSERRKATISFSLDCCTPGRRGFITGATVKYHPTFKDRTGQKIGRWTLLKPIKHPKKPLAVNAWLCRCSCGTVKKTLLASLIGGHSMSCGCLRNEMTSIKERTHGHTMGRKASPEYVSWSSMRVRCSGNTAHNRKYYKNRGIKVCKRWERFENFLKDMGPRPSLAYSLDRINPRGDYKPSNCRWATDLEQANNATSCIYIKYKGETKTLSQWARQFGMSRCCLDQRIRLRGMSVHKALTTPRKNQNRRVYWP